jgi:hypothetical protein
MKTTLQTNDDFKLIQENFPRIAEQIDSAWGTKELPQYINSLMLDSSDGDRNRQGFPLEIASALMCLWNTHDIEFPQFSRVVSNKFN